jgi:hypothetical protein
MQQEPSSAASSASRVALLLSCRLHLLLLRLSVWRSAGLAEVSTLLNSFRQ